MTYKPSAADIEAAQEEANRGYEWACTKLKTKDPEIAYEYGVKAGFLAGIAHGRATPQKIECDWVAFNMRAEMEKKHAQEMAEVSALVKKAFEITENTECATWNDHYYRKSVVDRFRNAAKKWLEERVK